LQGREAALRRRPINVMVNHHSAKIDYVPRNDSAALADFLSCNEVFSAKIMQINFANRWQPLRIVYF
jgi:hypothetical protein